MNITIAICTWNRAELLDQTLTHMRYLRIPEGLEWELVVVNNNCTDRTDEVIARYAEVLPLRRLFEPKQGHSHARNCAIDAAKGELLIWTDDDVLVDPNWLSEYWLAVKVHPKSVVFGGPIEPWFESSPPSWIAGNIHFLNGVFALAHGENETREFRAGESPTGANMAFRTSVLREFKFAPHLGRVRSSLISADDKELCQRMFEAGHRGVWVGTARVQHFIPRDRMTRQYLWKWFHGGGRTEVRLGKITTGPTLARVPRWIWRRYLEESAKRFVFGLASSNGWFPAFRNSAILRGIIDEYRAQR